MRSLRNCFKALSIFLFLKITIARTLSLYCMFHMFIKAIY